jgi:hypothetical protein
MYGMLVPFHILTIKNISSNQDGDHSYVRVNFNFGLSYEPGLKFPKSIFIKELSFRCSDVKHAAKVRQAIGNGWLCALLHIPSGHSGCFPPGEWSTGCSRDQVIAQHRPAAGERNCRTCDSGAAGEAYSWQGQCLATRLKADYPPCPAIVAIQNVLSR